MKQEKIVTDDWSDFGHKEIEEAKELLSHIKEINSEGKVTVFFNLNSGYVFLSDEDYNVWMMNGDKIERFYSCPECGNEGFKNDFKETSECEGCRDIHNYD